MDDVRLSHLSKDYLLTYLLTEAGRESMVGKICVRGVLSRERENGAGIRRTGAKDYRHKKHCWDLRFNSRVSLIWCRRGVRSRTWRIFGHFSCSAYPPPTVRWCSFFYGDAGRRIPLVSENVSRLKILLSPSVSCSALLRGAGYGRVQHTSGRVVQDHTQGGIGLNGFIPAKLPRIVPQKERTASAAIPNLVKCFPVLYYGLEACPLRKSQYNSVDYVINSSLRKVFDTKSQEVIDVCLGMFNCLSCTAGYCLTQK